MLYQLSHTFPFACFRFIKLYLFLFVKFVTELWYMTLTHFAGTSSKTKMLEAEVGIVTLQLGIGVME